MAVQLLLGSIGTQVTTVENGKAAVELFKARSFDLVIMDVEMPIMDGLTAIRQIRAFEAETEKPRTPIHTLSANSLPEHCRASLAAGADSHMTKPLVNSVLVSVVLAAGRDRNPHHVTDASEGPGPLSEPCNADLRRLSHVFEDAPSIVALMTGPEHVFTFANRAYCARLGSRPLVGLPFRSAIPELEAQGLVALLDAVYDTGEPFTGRGVKIALPSGPGGALEERYFDFLYQPVRHEEKVCGIFFQGQDVTDRENAVLRHQQMVRELEHRVKNTLAAIMAIAGQSGRLATSFAEFRSTFEGRLIALSRTHDALMSSHGESGDLHEILRRELQPYESDRIELSGEPVRLSTRDAVMFGMVVHELVTNAVKYGALSTPTGGLTVSWRVDTLTGEKVVVDWQEADGPLVVPPCRVGYGFQLIERAISRRGRDDLGIKFQRSGVSCRLELPVYPGSVKEVAADDRSVAGAPSRLKANISGENV